MNWSCELLTSTPSTYDFHTYHQLMSPPKKLRKVMNNTKIHSSSSFSTHPDALSIIFTKMMSNALTLSENSRQQFYSKLTYLTSLLNKFMCIALKSSHWFLSSCSAVEEISSKNNSSHTIAINQGFYSYYQVWSVLKKKLKNWRSALPKLL